MEGAFDKWHKAQQAWLANVCHTQSIERCNSASLLVAKKNTQVETAMKDLFHQASLEEHRAFERVLSQVEDGTRPDIKKMDP